MTEQEFITLTNEAPTYAELAELASRLARSHQYLIDFLAQVFVDSGSRTAVSAELFMARVVGRAHELYTAVNEGRSVDGVHASARILQTLQYCRNYIERVSEATHHGEVDFANYDLLDDVEQAIELMGGNHDGR